MCKLIINESFERRHKVNKNDFSRNSPLRFPILIKSIIHLFKESIEYNIANILPSLGVKSVSGSAFTQARYKINPSAFQELNQLVVDQYMKSNIKLWKGHRLIGVDGSTINLPPSKDIVDYFGVYAQTKFGIKRSLARITFFHDLMNDFIVENEITTMNKGELTHLKDGLKKINNLNDIYIIDRGYGHYNTLLHLSTLDIQFCARVSVKTKFGQKVIDDNRSDFLCYWNPSPKEKENAIKNNMKPCPLSIRVTKIKLKTGETEILISSLTNQINYPTKDIKWLYKKRWGVEEAFKKLKPKMKIEHFGCRKTMGIFQEFYAHVLMMNIVSYSIIITEDQYSTKSKRSLKYSYKYNWQNAYRYVRNVIIDLLSNVNIKKTIDELLIKIAKSKIPIIPNRTFPRDIKRGCNKTKISQCFK